MITAAQQTLSLGLPCPMTPAQKQGSQAHPLARDGRLRLYYLRVAEVLVFLKAKCTMWWSKK
jgi:hypothetical protein